MPAGKEHLASALVGLVYYLPITRNHSHMNRPYLRSSSDDSSFRSSPALRSTTNVVTRRRTVRHWKVGLGVVALALGLSTACGSTEVADEPDGSGSGGDRGPNGDATGGAGGAPSAGSGGSSSGGTGAAPSSDGAGAVGGEGFGGLGGTGGLGGAGSSSEIGLDVRHGHVSTAGTLGHANFSEFRAEVGATGYAVEELTSFRAADLSGLRAVILSMPYDDSLGADVQGYTQDEIDDLVAFVEDGGGALLLAEAASGKDVANMNQLAAHWGVQFGTSSQAIGGEVFDELVSHALTENVASFAVDFYLPIDSIAGSTLDLTSSTRDVLAVRPAPTFGEGNVVIVGDQTLWANSATGSDYHIDSVDNLRLLRNVLDYVLR